MLTRPFGPTKLTLPVIGQGSWQIAETGKKREDAKRALRRGIELGMVHIDTAEMYGGAEDLIGEAIEGLPRKDLFIVTKVLPSNASYNGTIKACESSLKRLRTDYLDCYLLHWRGSLPLEETMRAFEELVANGKVRTIGVSNFEIRDMEEAGRYLQKERIACNQVLYNLGERGIERRLITFCSSNNISVVGYTPFGKIPPPSSPQGKILQKVAEKHGSTVRQLLLAFLTRDKNLFAIPKASAIRHVEENAAACNIKLDDNDVRALDGAFPAPTEDAPLSVL